MERREEVVRWGGGVVRECDGGRNDFLLGSGFFLQRYRRVYIYIHVDRYTDVCIDNSQRKENDSMGKLQETTDSLKASKISSACDPHPRSFVPLRITIQSYAPSPLFFNTRSCSLSKHRPWGRITRSPGKPSVSITKFAFSSDGTSFLSVGSKVSA